MLWDQVINFFRGMAIEYRAQITDQASRVRLPAGANRVCNTQRMVVELTSQSSSRTAARTILLAHG